MCNSLFIGISRKVLLVGGVVGGLGLQGRLGKQIGGRYNKPGRRDGVGGSGHVLFFRCLVYRVVGIYSYWPMNVNLIS